MLPLLGIAVLALTQHSWLPPLEGGGVIAALSFVAAMGLLCGFACLTAQVASAVAGYVFGCQVGTCLAVAGAGFAGIVGYALLSRIVRGSVPSLLARRPEIHGIFSASTQVGAARMSAHSSRKAWVWQSKTVRPSHCLTRPYSGRS